MGKKGAVDPVSTLKRTTLSAKLKYLDGATLADQRQVRVICSVESPDRVGDVVIQSGIDLSNYRRNPTVLWQHDPDMPVARCVDIGVVGGALQATAQFPAEGKDRDADWAYGKIKAGLVNATSIGFDPLDYQLRADGSYLFKKSELLEFSFCSVPMHPDALVIARSRRHQRRAEPEPINLGMLLHEVSYYEAMACQNEDELRRAYAKRDRGTRLLGGIPYGSPWFGK